MKYKYPVRNRKIPYVPPRLECVVSKKCILHEIILTLEGASFVFGIATECYLRPPPIENFDNVSVCDIAHLIVLVYDFSILVADSPLLGRHQRITSFILGANIAVDARPSLFTFAIIALPHRSIPFIIC